jgi:histidinol-phosphatase
MNKSNELELALGLCQKAGEIALKYWPSGDRQLKIDRKSDGSEVTQADREAERMLREQIAKIYPDDGFLGEEEGESPAQAGGQRRWIIDPIDGTFGYSKGLPIFATLLALENYGEIVMGVVHAPAMDETLWAEKGGGAFKNGKKIYTSDCNQLSKAFFTHGGLNRTLQKGYWPGFTNLVNNTYRQKGPGDYLSFAMVFEGKADIAIEIGVKAWDLAPMKILAQESGGKYSDLTGGESIYTGNCLITNGHLFEQALHCFELEPASAPVEAIV